MNMIKMGKKNENQDIMFGINDQLFLETLLTIIRGNTIKYSSIKKRKCNEEENKLEQEIKKKIEDEIINNFLNIDIEKNKYSRSK